MSRSEKRRGAAAPPLLLLLVAPSLSLSSAFVVPSSSSRAPGGVGAFLRLSAAAADDDDSTVLDPTTRTFRVSTPASVATALLFGGILGGGEGDGEAPLRPPVANAGVGAPIPYAVSRKEYLPGSLTNEGASIRIEAALRKKLKYGPKTTVAIGRASPPYDSSDMADSLAGKLGKDLGGGGAAAGGVLRIPCDEYGVPADPKGALGELASRCPRAVVVYGPSLGISGDGTVGFVERSREEYESGKPSSDSVKGAEGNAKAIVAATLEAYKKASKKVEEAAASSGLEELTLVGGVSINRSKFGKDQGEDCFYPLSFKTLKGGEVVDLYGGAFGDLGVY